MSPSYAELRAAAASATALLGPVSAGPSPVPEPLAEVGYGKALARPTQARGQRAEVPAPAGTSAAGSSSGS
jgi:hypothetical protein